MYLSKQNFFCFIVKERFSQDLQFHQLTRQIHCIPIRQTSQSLFLAEKGELESHGITTTFCFPSRPDNLDSSLLRSMVPHAGLAPTSLGYKTSASLSMLMGHFIFSCITSHESSFLLSTSIVTLFCLDTCSSLYLSCI